MKFITLTNAIDGTIVLVKPESVDAVLGGYGYQGRYCRKVIVSGEPILVTEKFDDISRLLQATTIRINVLDEHRRILEEEHFAVKDWEE